MSVRGDTRRAPVDLHAAEVTGAPELALSFLQQRLLREVGSRQRRKLTVCGPRRLTGTSISPHSSAVCARSWPATLPKAGETR